MIRLDKLPIGIEDFEKIRTQGFYYVDKTALIRELLLNWGEVNLFTRPRRFGKSLNMSMLKYFFEYGCEKRLFEGLHIADEPELCQEYMGKFPVISISLKGVNGSGYRTARSKMCAVIGNEALRFQFLLEGTQLTQLEKQQYQALVAMDSAGSFSMPDAVLDNSLLTLSMLLWKYYGQKVIILIDEYDVSLDHAQQSGYYGQMVLLLRNLFVQALKTNQSLYFSVLTGCLTQEKRETGGFFQLRIPNREIRQIFIDQISQWFEDELRKDSPRLDAFCQAFINGTPEAIEKQLNAYLLQTIGIHDYSTRQELKENYYHGLLADLLKHREDWAISSNAESGEGFSDLLVESYGKGIGAVIEIKSPSDGDLAGACAEALQQIEERKYETKLIDDGMGTILKYGIALYKKHCKVVLEK